MRYLGGKSKIAKKILPYLTRHEAGLYIEPFVGGLGMFEKAASHFDRAIACDVHEDLISMYKSYQLGWRPDSAPITKEQYRGIRQQDPSPQRTFVGYAGSFGGKWFGGLANDKDGRNYLEQGARSLDRSYRAGAFGANVSFVSRSFFDLEVVKDPHGVVLYCDPPYADTTGYNATSEFDSAKAWERYHEWAKAGAHVYISEYSGPEEYLVAEFDHTRGLRTKSKAGKAPEKLFYIPSGEGEE